ncbi:LysR family transcriptional regulator [Serratia rubidaea]|uniref:LysR family transcriptional regulator n=1 Tax=Serratia rubidaea TaxID=61652 RepID=UPI0023B1CCA0|nr:LysR family transcriptional regulator [Serratia rubidaea]MDK1705077.1 LysR family transcriptional regulator [Serratia rubidaea]
MRTDDIDALLAVVQFASLNRAAEHLGISQSAITRRLQSFEQSLGATLLDRQTKPLKLTAIGRRVYEQCLTIKRETKRLESLLNQDAEPSGPLRLGIPQSLSEIALQPALTALGQHYPQLRPQVMCGWGGQLLKRLENVELDSLLAMGPAQQTFDDSLEAKALCPLEIVVIASKHLNLSATRLSDCAHHGWILNPDGCGLRAGLTRDLQSQSLGLKINVETAGAQLQISLVAQGLGLGLVPKAALIHSPHQHEIAVMELADFQPKVQLWQVSSRGLGNLQQPTTFFAEKIVQELLH